MSKPALHFIPAAKADLQEIWHYTVDRWGKKQAESYSVELKSACYQLIESPQLGRLIPEAGSGVRVYRCQHHYIFYLAEEPTIFLAFMHKNRDILQHIITRLP